MPALILFSKLVTLYFPSNLYQTSNDPLREALKALCGEEPPNYVKGFNIKNLTGFQVMELQDWCTRMGNRA